VDDRGGRIDDHIGVAVQLDDQTASQPDIAVGVISSADSGTGEHSALIDDLNSAEIEEADSRDPAEGFGRPVVGPRYAGKRDHEKKWEKKWDKNGRGKVGEPEKHHILLGDAIFSAEGGSCFRSIAAQTESC
jgi:hypothetical protein